MNLIENTLGDYSFLTGIAPYSSGVVAMPGFEIIHVQVRNFPSLSSGLERIGSYLHALGRPLQALCAIELRIPEPLSFSGFADFNGQYRSLIEQCDLLLGVDNPIARTNIAPATGDIDHPYIYAFSYTVESSGMPPTFVVAGAGDLRDQSELSPESIILPGKTDPEAMRSKGATVMQVMKDRLLGLRVSWHDVTDINVYTVQPLSGYLVGTLLKPADPAGMYGLRWHYSHPPIEGLAFEMNVRGVRNTVALKL